MGYNKINWFMITFLGMIALSCASQKKSFQKLVWQDEFEVDGAPDTTKWSMVTGDGCPNCGWGNGELQYYTGRKENAIIENGVLKIIAIKEDMNGSSYTSARMQTKGKFDIKYGKIEVRAKVPAGVGTWPAIWMLGANIGEVGWPACGEIDLMEHRGYEPNKIFGTLHYPERFGNNANGHYLQIEDAITKFNIYTTEWTKKSIKMMVNDKVIHQVENTGEIPFHHNFFLLLNMAVGGSFAGAVDPAFLSEIFEIDYIRVYQ
jgi:beta-glucanase (GH16 family)